MEVWWTSDLRPLRLGEEKKIELECGPTPNVMAALPNIGGALYGSSVIPFLEPRRKVWLTPAAGLRAVTLAI